MMHLPSAERSATECFEDESVRGAEAELPPGNASVAEAQHEFRVTAIFQTRPALMTRYRRTVSKAAPILATGAAALLALWSTTTWAGQMTLTTSYPVVNQIMTGNEGVAFALRFDTPVSHTGSRFMLLTPAGIRAIRLRLNSDPHTLAGVVGTLRPGRYELQWSAKTIDGEVTTGTIPFTVKP